MKIIYDSPLAARCAAQNRVNVECNWLSTLTITALAPFLGKKVIKADGTLTAAVRAILPVPAEDVQRWLAHSDRALCFNLKVDELTAGTWPGDTRAHYSEAYFYAGELENGVLVKLSEPTDRAANYDPAAVAALRKVAEAARETARDAESACNPFGLFDR